jgi:CSLREA domain-containing protein
VRRIGPRVQVRIEIKDQDTPFDPEGVDVDPAVCPGGFPLGCAELNVNRPDADSFGLDLNVDRETGNVTPFDSTGDASATATCTTVNGATVCSAGACTTGTQGQTAMMCFTITVGPPNPGTLVVTKTEDTNDGECSLSDCSLREALADARDDDDIFLNAFGHPYRLTYRSWVPSDDPIPGFDDPGHLKITRKNLFITGPETGASVVIEQTIPDARIFDIHPGGSATLRNLTLRGGTAGHTSTASRTHEHGGAIHNHGLVNLVNITITGNHAPITPSSTGGGGAIWNAGVMTLSNVTIAGNDAAQGPGGIGGAPATVVNSLFVDNTGAGGVTANCEGVPPVDGGGNAQFPGTTCPFAGPTLTSSPIGALATDYTFPLVPGSPAIDSALTSGGITEFDQAGTPRPLDGNGDGVAKFDPGAVEYDPEGLGVIHQPLNSATGQPGPVTLTFDNVTTAGTSTLTISSTGPARPAGFRAGTPALYYDVGTAAVFTGGVTVCVDYTGTAFANEAGLRLFHRSSSSSWQDTTQSLDTTANRICGRTTSFSVFAIFGANQAPVAFISEPPGGYRLNEGGSVVLQGSGSDPDGDPLTYEWSPATELNDRTLATPTFSPRDDGTRTYTLVVRDGEATSAPVSTTVRVDNVAPSLQLTGPASGSLYRAGSSVSIRGAFTDPGVLDTHTCTVDWDDGTPAAAGAVTEANGAGSCTASRTFAAAGVYTLVMTVDDGDGGTANASTMVVVYDPRAGWVLGAGHVAAPAGRTVFTFQAQYLLFGSTPIGVVAVLLPSGGRFASTTLEWLVVTGFKSQLRGVGQIAGLGSYGFLLTAYDGQRPGGDGVDRFRLKLWNRATGAVVYDNVLDPTATDDIDRAKPQATGAGSAIAIFRL